MVLLKIHMKNTWKDRKLAQKRTWETESQINQGELCPTFLDTLPS